MRCWCLRYERAARELLQREKARLEELHEHELRAVRAESESESTRHSVRRRNKRRRPSRAATTRRRWR